MRLSIGPILLFVLFFQLAASEPTPRRGRGRPLRQRQFEEIFSGAVKTGEAVGSKVTSTLRNVGDDTAKGFSRHDYIDINPNTHRVESQFNEHLNQHNGYRYPQVSSSYNTLDEAYQHKQEILLAELDAHRRRLDGLRDHINNIHPTIEQASNMAREQPGINEILAQEIQGAHQINADKIKENENSLKELQDKLDAQNGKTTASNYALGATALGTLGLGGIMLHDHHKQVKEHNRLTDANNQQLEALKAQDQQIGTLNGQVNTLLQNQANINYSQQTAGGGIINPTTSTVGYGQQAAGGGITNPTTSTVGYSQQAAGGGITNPTTSTVGYSQQAAGGGTTFPATNPVGA